jgi:NAD-dependent dihydropyrimidine dehydrogenase PreA subunit
VCPLRLAPSVVIRPVRKLTSVSGFRDPDRHQHDIGADVLYLVVAEHMAYVIAEPCIGTKDSACVDACPVDCIHPKKEDPRFEAVEMLYIDPVECIDCGACVPVCPVSAIFAVDDLPEKWSEFTKKNAEFFGRA